MKQEQIRRQPSRVERERRREDSDALAPVIVVIDDVVSLDSVEVVLADIDAVLTPAA